MPDTSTSTMEAAEKELQKILVLRFNTAFERRMETLKHEMQAAEDEFRLAGALHSGAFVKKILELRCKAVRDIVLGTLHSAKEVRSRHGLSWTEGSLSETGKKLEELIGNQFSSQKEALQQQLARMYKPNDSVVAWAFRELEKETSKLSTEIAREIEILRSETKITTIAVEQGGDAPALAGLGKTITKNQREIINAIWKYYREHQEWIPTRILHHDMKKEFVMSAVEPLGGSIIFKSQAGAKECYELTLLGVLLSDYGPEAEKLLVGYLGYIRNQYLENAMVEKVTAEEVQQSLQLIDEQVELLGLLISLGYFHGGNVSSGKRWECRVPKDIDDLPAVADFRGYVQKRALRDYDPKEPIEPNDRLRYSLSKGPKQQETEFNFIQDPLLRDQLEKDWDEVQRVRGVKAWKSCVILCGGILEGMLLDVLKRDQQRARSAHQKRKGKEVPDLDQWDLVDLVNVAKDLGMLSKSAEYLGHGLREFRNLIHPGKQVREKVGLTQEEAEIAYNVVKVCLREFLSKFEVS